MHSEIPPYLFVIFMVATAAGVILQAIILLVIALVLLRVKKKVEMLTDEARVHLMPAIAKSRSLIDDLGPKVAAVVNDLSPKIKIVSTDVVEITRLIRRETENVKGAVDEVVGRTRGQAARVDGMFTGTLDGVEHATATIQRGVAIPIRKISGWIAGIRAGLEVLRGKGHKNAQSSGSYDDAIGYDEAPYVSKTTSVDH